MNEFFAPTPLPRLVVVDVFAPAPLTGNPAAVVLGAGALGDAALQAIARETNLSETVFLLAPREGGDYRARIFTTRREIPFAGHPSLAAAHAFSELSGLVARPLVQECGLGRISVAPGSQPGEWRVGLPEPRLLEPEVAPTDLGAALGLSEADLGPARPLIGATGVPWLLVEIARAADLARIEPDHRRIATTTRAAGSVGLVAFARDPQPGISASLRAFAPAEGIYEDPVCGSCGGALAALFLAQGEGMGSRFVFAQGDEIGRPGRMTVTREPDGALVLSGHCITVLDGRLAA